MIALLRYRFALLGHSQRYLPPALVYVAALAAIYTDPTAPVPPEFAVSAGALVVFACWLTVAALDLEDPVQRLVTLSHARRPIALVTSSALAVLVACVPLALLSVGWAAWVHGGVPASALGAGLLAHLACALAGIGVALPCSRLLVSRLGFTVATALGALTLVLLVRQVPLVNPLLRAMGRDAEFTGQAVLAVALSASALAVSLAVTSAVAARRS